MTLLINKNSGSGGSGPIIRNYSIASSDTEQIIASTTNARYMKGSVFINDTTDSLFFNYSISHFNSILTTVIYGIIGKEFDISISDFSAGSNAGLVITNNEAVTLTVSIIQEL